MSKPSPNRNREKGANGVLPLAPRIPLQLVKSGCAQKESNLQPASSGADSHGVGSSVLPLLRTANPADSAPTDTESAFPNRNQSVTEDYGFAPPAHKPFSGTSGLFARPLGGAA